VKYLTLPLSLMARMYRFNTSAASLGILLKATWADSQYSPRPYLYARFILVIVLLSFFDVVSLLTFILVII